MNQDYLVSKRNSRFEYRIYTDNSKLEGKLIFSGHRGSVELPLLEEILEYKYHLSSKRYFFLDYLKLFQENQWQYPNLIGIDFFRFSSDARKDMWESWNSLMSALSGEKYLRKVYITMVVNT